jgi:hypothetical protein
VTLSVAEVERWLDRLYVAAEGATLRQSERKKAREVAALLDEMSRALPKHARRELTLVDAAAGKAYVGLLAIPLLLQPRELRARVVLIERDHRRAAAAKRAAAVALAAAPGVHVDILCGDVGDASLWPAEPELVVALHACAGASDAIIARAAAACARRILVVQCCVAADLPAARRARAQAQRLGLEPHGELRRRLVDTLVAGERATTLEALGYETVVVELVPVSVTPQNLLLRSRRVGEPQRMRDAAARLAALRGE